MQPPSVPKGPLAVRWHDLALPPIRAGAFAKATVELENAGSVAWESRVPFVEGIHVAYHWLDARGNAIVWDGWRTPLTQRVAPGERATIELRIQGPIPPGPYTLAVDAVDEGRLWFEELGNPPLVREILVAPRVRRALGVILTRRDEETRRALTEQEEPLADARDADAVAYLTAGCLPPPDWSRRVLDAHEEGYAIVGGSIEPVGGMLARRSAARRLAEWAPGTGRVPRFAEPLLCPSIVRELDPGALDELHGLPALRPNDEHPWLYDGRLVIKLKV